MRTHRQGATEDYFEYYRYREKSTGFLYVRNSPIKFTEFFVIKHESELKFALLHPVQNVLAEKLLWGILQSFFSWGFFLGNKFPPFLAKQTERIVQMKMILSLKGFSRNHRCTHGSSMLLHQL